MISVALMAAACARSTRAAAISADAAIAITLSRLITMSAMATMRTARQRFCAPSTPLVLAVGVLGDELDRHVEQQRAADQLEVGIAHRLRDDEREDARAAARRRRRRGSCPTAAARGGSVMQAIAMTTALSPDRMMLTPMI